MTYDPNASFNIAISSKKTPGLLEYCSTITNNQVPPKNTFKSTWFFFLLLFAIIGLLTVLYLVFTFIKIKYLLRAKQTKIPILCPSLRRSIMTLARKGTNILYMDWTLDGFYERYECVKHHDDLRTGKRTITIIEKLEVVEAGSRIPSCLSQKKIKEEGTTGGDLIGREVDHCCLEGEMEAKV